MHIFDLNVKKSREEYAKKLVLDEKMKELEFSRETLVHKQNLMDLLMEIAQYKIKGANNG